MAELVNDEGDSLLLGLGAAEGCAQFTAAGGDPPSLIRSDDGRRFARLGAALAGFYFTSEDVYAAGLRRKVVEEVTIRVENRKDTESVLALRSGSISGINWKVSVHSASPVGPVLVDVGACVMEAANRMALIDRANSLVTTDREILGGIPIFRGTRIPIDVILACLKEMKRADVLKAYPDLTEERLEAAEVYSEVHPRRGRPSKTPSFPASWKIKSTHRVAGHNGKK